MSTQFVLSLVLGATGITGIFLAGPGRWQGWLIGLLVQPVWVVFAITTQAWGLLVLPVGYGWVYARNLLRWRSRTADPAEPRVCRCGHTRDRHAWARSGAGEFGCLDGWRSALGGASCDRPEATYARRRCACMSFRPRWWWPR